MHKRYSIKTAAQLSGMNVHTIRAWEKRHSAINPKRTKTGRRIYADCDIQKLILLKTLNENGHSIGLTAHLSNEELIKISKENNLTLQHQQLKPNTISNQKKCLKRLLFFIENFQFDKISKELLWARTFFDVKTFILEVIAPLLQHIGDLIIEKKLTIAHEHTISATLRSHLGDILSSLNLSEVDQAKFNICFTTPEGDFHEFGILLSAILCVSHGIKINYFGPNMPLNELLLVSKKIEPNLIVIGLAEYKKSHQDFLYLLNKNKPKNTSLWIGGAKNLLDKIKTDGTNIQKISSFNEFNEKIEHFEIQ